METVVFGLLGAALGIGLYRLGWAMARRTPKNGTAERELPAALTPLSSKELYNFLRYDGGEPKEEQRP